MKNCYDLTLELIQVMGDIDRALDKAAKTSRVRDKEILLEEVDRLEVRMYEIKNILKGKEVY